MLVIGLGGAVLLSVSNSFKPRLTDVADPLGRPSALAKEVIHSASEFQRITGILVPKHSSLSQRIQRLGTVADDLGTVVNQAGRLPGTSETVNHDTSAVSGVAAPLPGLIDHVTSRARQATPVVGDLGASVTGVTTQIDAVHTQLTGAFTDLAALGPRARTIVALLAQIQAESVKVRPIMPLLQALKGPLSAVENVPLLNNILALLVGNHA